MKSEQHEVFDTATFAEQLGRLARQTALQAHTNPDRCLRRLFHLLKLAPPGTGRFGSSLPPEELFEEILKESVRLAAITLRLVNEEEGETCSDLLADLYSGRDAGDFVTISVSRMIGKMLDDIGNLENQSSRPA